MSNNRIGFMQGRLSALRDGRIQSFPWDHWQEEFHVAFQRGFPLMEWTLDQERLYENPLLTETGRTQISNLSQKYGVEIHSLTGDCFMQAPFWKASGKLRVSLENDFVHIVKACAALKIFILVIPLVDHGCLETREQENILVSFLKSQTQWLREQKVCIAFESDFDPDNLARFIESFDSDVFGINYDIGNSASFGYNPNKEMAAYGGRIVNVHIKDRVLGGTTVALGYGNADFERIFSLLKIHGYKGNYILQTARADNDDHVGVLSKYFKMTQHWLSSYES